MQTLNASLSTLLANMPPTTRAIWGLFAVLMLVAVLIAVWLERRRYVGHNQAGAWLLVRIATVPIIAASAAAVVIPSRAVGGPEALAAFYLLAFTLGPLVYFGLHWLVGVVAGLSRGDALYLGGSGLLMVLLPVLLASQANRWVFELTHAIDGTAKEAQFVPGQQKSSPYRVTNQRRFLMPEVGEVWTERWGAPPGVQIERIELNVRGRYAQVDGANSTYVCRTGPDVDVFWHGGVAPAQWRVHWYDASGQRAFSEWVMTPPTVPAVPLTPEWHPDGVSLPVRVPAAMVSYAWMRENGQLDGRLAVGPGVGTSAVSECVETLRFPVTPTQPQISGVNIRLWRIDTQEMLYARLSRPEAAPTGVR